MDNVPLNLPNDGVSGHTAPSLKSTSNNKPRATDLKSDPVKSRAPLFIQFKMLSLMKAEAKKKLSHVDDIQPPQPVVQSKQDIMADCATFEPANNSCTVVYQIEKLWQSANFKDICQGATLMAPLVPLVMRNRSIEDLPEDSLNNISESCAKLLSFKDYSQLYPAFVAGIQLQIIHASDYWVLEKYNTIRRLHKLISTRTDESFLFRSFELLYNYHEHNKEALIKLLITFTPKVKYLSETSQSVLDLYKRTIKVKMVFKTALWIDFYNQVKYEGSDFSTCKLLLTYICLTQNYKSCRNWFQRQEFDLTIEILQADNLQNNALVLMFHNLIRDAHEKVYDPLLVAQTYKGYPLQTTDCHGESSFCGFTSYIVDSIVLCFPPLGKYEARVRKSPIAYKRKEVPVPTFLENAAEIFDCYLHLLNRISISDIPAWDTLYSEAYGVCDYMILNHRKQFVQIAKKHDIFEIILKFVKKSTFTSAEALEPMSLLMLLCIPELHVEHCISQAFNVLLRKIRGGKYGMQHPKI